jgi:hypothetical protein
MGMKTNTANIALTISDAALALYRVQHPETIGCFFIVKQTNPDLLAIMI